MTRSRFMHTFIYLLQNRRIRFRKNKNLILNNICYPIKTCVRSHNYLNFFPLKFFQIEYYLQSIYGQRETTEVIAAPKAQDQIMFHNKTEDVIFFDRLLQIAFGIFLFTFTLLSLVTAFHFH